MKNTNNIDPKLLATVTGGHHGSLREPIERGVRWVVEKVTGYKNPNK